MTVARVRLLLAAVLFFGWLGWLAYLAYFKTHPVVVSRSQVMRPMLERGISFSFLHRNPTGHFHAFAFFRRNVQLSPDHLRAVLHHSESESGALFGEAGAVVADF